MRKTLPETDLGKFLHHMNGFFEFIKQTFPNDKDLEYYHDQFLEFKKYNASLIAQMFVESTIPYEAHILSRNDKFFLDELKLEELQKNMPQNLPINIGDYEKGLYEKIRRLWLTDLEKTAKNTIWKYFAILLGYGKKTMNLM